MPNGNGKPVHTLHRTVHFDPPTFARVTDYAKAHKMPFNRALRELLAAGLIKKKEEESSSILSTWR